MVMSTETTDAVDDLLGIATPSLPFADISAALDGDQAANVPATLFRSDGQGLLYRAAVNTFAGEPGDGKTTLALIAARAVLGEGGSVIFIDAEDVVCRVVARLIALGARPADLVDRFKYLSYADLIPDTATTIARVADYITTHHTALTILDGVADALGAHGFDEDRATDYSKWHALVPKPLAAAGAAVILNDHMAKNRDGRGLWPRGSGHKLAAIDGVAYHITAPTPFSRTNAGVIEVTIAKDRAGHIGPKKTKAARILITPHDDGARIEYQIERALFGPEATTEGAPSLLPELPDRIVEAIEALIARDGAPGPTRNVIEAELRSRALRFDSKTLTPTLHSLERDGRITITPRPGGGHFHALPACQTTIDTEVEQ